MTRKSLAAAAVLLTASLAFRLGPPDASYPLRPGELHAVAVSGETAEVDLPFATADEHYLLVVSSLARDALSREIALESRPVEVVARVPLRRVPELSSLAKSVPPASENPPRPAGGVKPSIVAAATRTFWLNVSGEADENPAAFRPIHARLADEGEHLRVYVDRDDAVDADATAAIVEGFDRLLRSSYVERIGRAPDVDGDGKLAIVLTSWLDRLHGGTVAVGGLVQPRDFDPLLAPPRSNRADVLFLNAANRPGAHLRNLLAHEYAHAVLAGTRNAQAPGRAAYEESWLDEAIAHQAETLGGEGWSNLDYRVAAFLACPRQAPLVVADYQAAGLWRSPSPRGHTFLFLRWCDEQFGPELLPALIQSRRRGCDNVQAATGEPFEELFRRFAADLQLREWATAANEGESAAASGPPPPRLTEPLGGWPLAGPRRETWELSATGEARSVGIAGTSSAYYLLSAAEPGPQRLTIRGSADAALQVSLVRLPNDLPRLTLRVVGGRGARRIEVACRGGRGVTLEQLAWGVAAFSPQATAAHASVRGAALASLMGDVRLSSGGRLLSQAIDFAALPGGEVYVSVVAVDEQGRRVTGWASLEAAETPLAGL